MEATSTMPEITGLILAGGRGSRMQHRDKGLQPLNGKTLVEHIIDRLKPQVTLMAINANRHIDDYRRFGFPVWPDSVSDPNSDPDVFFQGPLAGVETGLLHCSTPYLLTVPCDSPFLPLDLTQRLMAAINQQNADIAVACTGDPAQPRLQPVFCLMHQSRLRQLQSYFHSGGHKMDGWYQDSTVAKVYFSDESEFGNINTLEELRDYASR